MNLAGLTESEVNIWGHFLPSESDQKNLWLERQARKEVLHVSICNKAVESCFGEIFPRFTEYKANG